jgi:hypothetical protein
VYIWCLWTARDCITHEYYHLKKTSVSSSKRQRQKDLLHRYDISGFHSSNLGYDAMSSCAVCPVVCYHTTATACLLAGAAWLITKCYQQLLLKLFKHHWSSVLSRVKHCLLCVLIWFDIQLTRFSEWNFSEMLESVGENCIVNFPGTQSQAQETTMNLLKQVHWITSGQEIARNCYKMLCAYQRNTRRSRGYVTTCHRNHWDALHKKLAFWSRQLQLWDCLNFSHTRQL